MTKTYLEYLCAKPKDALSILRNLLLGGTGVLVMVLTCVWLYTAYGRVYGVGNAPGAEWAHFYVASFSHWDRDHLHANIVSGSFLGLTLALACGWRAILILAGLTPMMVCVAIAIYSIASDVVIVCMGWSGVTAAMKGALLSFGIMRCMRFTGLVALMAGMISLAEGWAGIIPPEWIGLSLSTTAWYAHLAGIITGLAVGVALAKDRASVLGPEAIRLLGSPVFLLWRYLGQSTEPTER